MLFFGNDGCVLLGHALDVANSHHYGSIRMQDLQLNP